jgi:hypothetical protein
MNYPTWRITFQSADQAARSAFDELQAQYKRAEELQAKLDKINGISTRCDKTVDMFGGDK